MFPEKPEACPELSRQDLLLQMTGRCSEGGEPRQSGGRAVSRRAARKEATGSSHRPAGHGSAPREAGH